VEGVLVGPKELVSWVRRGVAEKALIIAERSRSSVVGDT